MRFRILNLFKFTLFKLILLCACGWLLSGCSSQLQKNTLVLEYADFGPQTMAYKALGPKNLQWQPQEPLLLGQGKVYVVVYKNISIDDVQHHFRPDHTNHLDYRYIQYGDALNYLDARIAQNLLRKITTRLQKTRKAIVSRLP